MKTYTVIRSTSGEIGCVVNDGAEATVLRHCEYQSPTGFETGFAGSGPADLALSILADYFDATPHAVKHVADRGFGCRCAWCGPNRSGAEKALLFHMPFKFKFIAPRQLDRGGDYVIHSDQIDAYLHELLHPSEVARPEPARQAP